MPVAQVPWSDGPPVTPVTAGILDTAMYTYSPGNNHAPNGVLFHAFPPMLTEIMRANPGFSQASTATGASSEVNLLSNGAWQNQGDTSALFSIGADRAGSEGSGQYISRVPGSDGTAGTMEGWHFIWGFPSWAAQAHNGGAGGVIAQTNVSPGNLTFGGFQYASTAQKNTSYVFDLIHCGTPTTGYTIAGICADSGAGSFAYQFSASFSGPGCRFSALWACSAAGGSQYTLGSMPSVLATWTAATEASAANLNGSIASPLQLLTFPPALRVATSLSTAMTANTPLNVALSTPTLDSYGGFSGNTYTVPLTGVYLVHAVASIANGAAGGNCFAGVSVNGTAIWGPAGTFTADSSAVTRPQMTRLLDLQAGDTVKLFAQSSATAQLSSSVPCRLVLKWMGALAPDSTPLTYTSPDAWYRWQAGTPGADLPAAFTSAVGNDIGFLVNRPYLLASQGTAQTGLTANAWHVITMGAGGLIHGSPGDNYGGWVAGSANYYQAIVPGWYLAVATYIQAAITGAANHAAGIGYLTPSGSAQGSSSPDVYQQVASANTTAGRVGAEAVGLYYLNTGDRLQPQYNEVSGSTYSTSSTAGQLSSFGCIWVSE